MSAPSIRYHAELYEILGFNPPLDGLLTALTGHRRIDIIALDKALELKHGPYPDGESMNDFVHKTYGERACQLIDLLI